MRGWPRWLVLPVAVALFVGAPSPTIAQRTPRFLFPSVDPDFRPARKAHAGLLVTGLDALIEELRRAGYQVATDEPLEGYLRVYVNDPFGNRLELMEPRSAR